MKHLHALYLFLFLLRFVKWSSGYKRRKNITPYGFLCSSRNNVPNRRVIIKRHNNVKKKSVNNIKDVKDINVGELKVGRVSNVVDNDIYVKLKTGDNEEIIIKKEYNYLLENELLYEYLYSNNFIDHVIYNKLMRKVNPNWKDKVVRAEPNQVTDCVVLIKEIDEKNKIIGELFTSEISKRKEKIYDKLNELKNSEKKIFIKILKNIRNKYFVVLINGCIRGYLMYDENDEHSKNILQFAQSSKKLGPKLSAYIIEVNKKLEYVFLSLKKVPKNEMNEKLLNLQHTIAVENLFENVYFKGEVSNFCNDGNNIIVKIFENQNNSIKVKIKSHNIINTRNILRNFDYLKNKVIEHEFGKYYSPSAVEQINNEEKIHNHKMTSQRVDHHADGNQHNVHGPPETQIHGDTSWHQKKGKATIQRKDYNEKFKQFKENFYGCNDEDALKYINVDDYIYKKEKLLYVRIINKTSDPNLYEGSMIKSDPINPQIYDLIKKMSSEENIIINYDERLRYPSKVLGFFNNYVILSTRVLSTQLMGNQVSANVGTDASTKVGTDATANAGANTSAVTRREDLSHITTGYSKIDKGQIKDIVTLIEKRYIDYENLKEGDIFFCRFDNIKWRNARNIFNLSNSMINKIFNSYFKREKDIRVLVKKEEQLNGSTPWKKKTIPKEESTMEYYAKKWEKKNANKSKVLEGEKSIDQQIFEEIFFEKRNFYFMRAELHKDTEYRLNKNNIDKNFKLLKNICDNYYSGINQAYHRYPSIREEYILAYLGKDNYKLYRKLVSDYFCSNEHSYKEFLHADCENVVMTVFDLVFENPNILTVEMIKNYNKDLYERIHKLGIYELNYLLKDLIKLKNKLRIYPCSYKTKIGRMNLTLNNQKPVKKEHIQNLQIHENVKNELIKSYNNFVSPVEYIKEILLKKKQAMCMENKNMSSIYILAEETINLYENSAKDVEPHTDEQIAMLKAQINRKRSFGTSGMTDGQDSFQGALFDPENSQIRRLLNMIKEDLEKQKKKNKLDEVDREYDKEQNSYSDATDLYKHFPELEEMDELTKDMFYMKIPFVE
ncbi:conserved Plasmodium protein, unknown function [Plasmodium gonderi]|uniref:Uncharacterized protein n=1 Tax=Plasmodium gonderi TaxID=77519 RepID=A0A1Y1JME3_PLAGO|nr:conserved Plasmodium protein, unknown function [Plasmodium gonderi]GAW82377.1 conserved Plasmodium protein, unknown function [Plasmodium gonderi]